MNRRRFLARAGGLLVSAPIIVRASSIMPVRSLVGVEPGPYFAATSWWHYDYLNDVFTAGEGRVPYRKIVDGGFWTAFDAAFRSPRSEVAPEIRRIVAREVLDAMPKR